MKEGKTKTGTKPIEGSFFVNQSCFLTDNLGMATCPVLPKTRTAQEVSHAIITAAMKVHSELGAGLLESAYKTCLAFELRRSGLTCATEVLFQSLIVGSGWTPVIESICSSKTWLSLKLSQSTPSAQSTMRN